MEHYEWSGGGILAALNNRVTQAEVDEAVFADARVVAQPSATYRRIAGLASTGRVILVIATRKGGMSRVWWIDFVRPLTEKEEEQWQTQLL